MRNSDEMLDTASLICEGRAQKQQLVPIKESRFWIEFKVPDAQ
jgi:hypothetical protein